MDRLKPQEAGTVGILQMPYCPVSHLHTVSLKGECLFVPLLQGDFRGALSYPGTHTTLLGDNLFFLLFRAQPAVYGGSRARGPIAATAAGLRHSHVGSELSATSTPAHGNAGS